MNVDCNLFMQLLSQAPPSAPPQWLSKIGQKVWDDKVNLLGRLPFVVGQFANCCRFSYVLSLFWWRIFHATCSCSQSLGRSKGASDQRLSCIISGLKRRPIELVYRFSYTYIYCRQAAMSIISHVRRLPLSDFCWQMSWSILNSGMVSEQ